MSGKRTLTGDPTLLDTGAGLPSSSGPYFFLKMWYPKSMVQSSLSLISNSHLEGIPYFHINLYGYKLYLESIAISDIFT